MAGTPKPLIDRTIAQREEMADLTDRLRNSAVNVRIDNVAFQADTALGGCDWLLSLLKNYGENVTPTNRRKRINEMAVKIRDHLAPAVQYARELRRMEIEGDYDES